MADLKTKPTTQSVTNFLNKVEPEEKRSDSIEVLEMMEKITGEKPVMWGDSIVGFGTYHYKYASGHEGDTCMVGFSPKKNNLTLYLMGMAYKFDDNKNLLEKLGKYKLGKGCLYIKRLSDVDKSVLTKLIKKSYKQMKKNNPSS